MRQYWIAPLPPFHTADSTATTAVAAITDISPAPAIIVPANMLEAGSRLEFNVFGRFTSAATPGNAALGINIAPPATAIAAGNAIATTASVALAASQTNRTWRIEGNASVRAIGATGSIIGVLEVTNLTGTSPVSDTHIAPATAPTAITIDTTQALSVRVAVTPTVTTQTWTVHYFGVRLVN